MENKIDLREELIQKLEELMGEENAAMAFAKAKELKRRWPKVREEEESFSDQELSEKFNGMMDELAKKAGNVFVNTEEKKNEIIARAKEIVEKNNFKKGTEEMKLLLEEWKLAGRINKEKDDELWNQFSEVRKEFFEKKNEYFDNLKASFAENKKLKEEIIEKAKEVANIENIKEAGNRVNELMEEWKKVGSASRKEDDELWNQFLAERKAFFARRDAFFDEMKETFAKRVEEKKEIISQAKLYLARSEFTDEEVNAVKELRNRWKQIGNAGKNHENELWNEFNTILDKYFENMKYYK
ncbi:MAG: DUF349 domain-containing protein [Erysipelotrichaceae bacterium]|nr:DUF349 domain-containing protein [Erysipelotrichaceae bacterium]